MPVLGMNTVLARLRSTIALRKKQGQRDSSAGPNSASSLDSDWDFGARQMPDASLRVTVTSPPPPRQRDRERTYSLGADSPTFSRAVSATYSYGHAPQRVVYSSIC